MITSFKFSNLCSAFYKGGQLAFSHEKGLLLSPIGNRVRLFDLEANATSVLDVEARADIKVLALSPDSRILLAVDCDGHAVVISLPGRTVLSHVNFRQRVRHAKFSPNGKFLAIGLGASVKVYEAPSGRTAFEKLHLLRKLQDHHFEELSSVEWSPDSRFLITASKDLTVCVHNLHHLEFYVPIVISVHKQKVVKCFFNEEMTHLYSLDVGNMLFIWKWINDHLTDSYKRFREYQRFKVGKKLKLAGDQERVLFTGESAAEQEEGESTDEEGEEEYFSRFEQEAHKGRLVMSQKLRLNEKTNQKVKACEFHAGLKLFFLAYESGNFEIVQLEGESVRQVQHFQIANQKITSIALNSSGAWIALGVKSLGQLLVWEWRSQSYVLNQACMYYDVVCTAFSSSGLLIATGGGDGKIKYQPSLFPNLIGYMTPSPTCASPRSRSTARRSLDSASLHGRTRSSPRAWTGLCAPSTRRSSAASER